jgi:hypothetical protein
VELCSTHRFDLTSKECFNRYENFSVSSLQYFIDIFQKSSRSVEQRGRCGHRRLRGSLLSGSHSNRWSPSAILLGWMMFHGLVRSQFSLRYSYRARSPGSATERRMGPLAITISGFSRQGQALDRQRCLRLLGLITRDLFTPASPIAQIRQAGKPRAIPGFPLGLGTEQQRNAGIPSATLGLEG